MDGFPSKTKLSSKVHPTRQIHALPSIFPFQRAHLPHKYFETRHIRQTGLEEQHELDILQIAGIAFFMPAPATRVNPSLIARAAKMTIPDCIHERSGLWKTGGKDVVAADGLFIGRILNVLI